MVDTALDIAQALLHLHNLDVLHGDLKARNILLKSCGSEERGVIAKVSRGAKEGGLPGCCGAVRPASPQQPAREVRRVHQVTWQPLCRSQSTMRLSRARFTTPPPSRGVQKPTRPHASARMCVRRWRTLA